MTNLEDSFFCPSAVSGCALRSQFNNDFADSLEYLFTASQPHISFDAERARVLLSRIRSGSREAPTLYSLHFKLVDALKADDVGAAAPLLAKIVDHGPAEDGIKILSLGSPTDDLDADIVIPYFCEDASLFCYSRPETGKSARTKSTLVEAIEDIRSFAPGLADEMEALVSTVILAKGTQVDGKEPAEFESKPYHPHSLVQLMPAWGGQWCWPGRKAHRVETGLILRVCLASSLRSIF